MNEMIERVAKAIGKTVYETDRGGLTGWDANAVARAAIEAMREPTEAMLEAASGSIARWAWPAMIDAALVEP